MFASSRLTWSSAHAERMATAEALPPNTVSRWLMLGAKGAARQTLCGLAVLTSTAIALDSGMWA